MKSIIQQLQLEAADSTTSVTSLLAKAKIVATKLKLDDFLGWINQEINGYSGEVPSYRTIPVEVKAFNPYHGWQPVIFTNIESQKILSRRDISQPISGVEATIGQEGALEVPLNPEARATISEAIGFEGQITSFTSKNAIKTILEAVRNKVLDISLQLEAEGIVGDGITFSKEEVEVADSIAGKIHIGTIQNFSGSIGDISGQAVVSNEQNIYSINSVKELLDLIDQQKNNIGLNPEKLSLLNEEIFQIRSEIALPDPKQIAVRDRLSSIKSILQQVGTSLIVQMILAGLSTLVAAKVVS